MLVSVIKKYILGKTIWQTNYNTAAIIISRTCCDRTGIQRFGEETLNPRWPFETHFVSTVTFYAEDAQFSCKRLCLSTI